jgi:ADP-heptose:LPS heptosyltransferase
MRLSFMRNIDRFAGIPLCWIAGLVRMIVPPRSRSGTATAQVREILVIKFFGMGSILLTTPALRLIRDSFPGTRITFLTFGSNRGLLERIPLVDRILTVDEEGLLPFLVTAFRIGGNLLSGGYDIVFDFEFFSKFSTLLGALTGAPRRVGFALPTRWRSWHLTDGVPLSKDRHVTEAFCSQVWRISGKSPVPEVIPPVINETDVESMRQKLALPGQDTSGVPLPPIVAVNVNAGRTFLERRWPGRNFASLVTELSLESPDTTFYFTGSKADCPYVKSVIDLTSCPERCRNIAGLLDIPELAAFFRECETVISNDSGPLHLAAAAGARVVGLYGPETPVFYGPRSPEAATVYKGIECSPCMNVYAAKSFTCPYNARCMREILISDVRASLPQQVLTR